MSFIGSTSLNIESDIIYETSKNYHLSSWPPKDDFPVVIDKNEKTISFYGDSEWKLTPYTKTSCILNFGDGTKPSRIKNTKPNANLYRQIIAWWMWGPHPSVAPLTIKTTHDRLSKLFQLCSENNILASELYKYPKIFEQLPLILSAGRLGKLIYHLHSIFENREQIGFYILDRAALETLSLRCSDHEERQTAYIPPRIWLYQVQKLRLFLEDYLKIKIQLEKCYERSLEMYKNHYGSMELAFEPTGNRPGRGTPFNDRGCVDFECLADDMGIGPTLRKWMTGPSSSLNGYGKGIRLLSSYLTMASRLGLGYILNFTIMRVGEAWSLRADCLKHESDQRFGEFWTIVGETTKTQRDDDARWITSPSVAIAIDVMSHAAKLRLVAAQLNPKAQLNEEHISNPFLTCRAYEPWSARHNDNFSLDILPRYTPYADLVEYYPFLFDKSEIQINKQDLDVARLITPTLDSKKYYVGATWPFAWHQLRRTAAVNMQASNLVSEASLQYDMKHQTRFQSLYYGQGFSKLLFNEDARSEYVRSMYEVHALNTMSLLQKRFISPHGEKRKAAMLAPINKKNLDMLAAAAKAQHIPFREVLLGVCMYKGSCKFGGIDNFIRCGGGDTSVPCTEVMYDRKKLIPIKQLRAEILLRKELAAPDSPYLESLVAQLKSVDNALTEINKTKD